MTEEVTLAISHCGVCPYRSDNGTPGHVAAGGRSPTATHYDFCTFYPPGEERFEIDDLWSIDTLCPLRGKRPRRADEAHRYDEERRPRP